MAKTVLYDRVPRNFRLGADAGLLVLPPKVLNPVPSTFFHFLYSLFLCNLEHVVNKGR